MPGAARAGRQRAPAPPARPSGRRTPRRPIPRRPPRICVWSWPSGASVLVGSSSGAAAAVPWAPFSSRE